jgi:glucokinase
VIIGLDLAQGAPPAADHFPQPGSLEALAAGRALDHLAAESARARPDTALGRRLAAGDEVTGSDVVAVAHDGDEEAVRLLRVIGQRLGIGIASVINIFDPEQVATETAGQYVLPGVGSRSEIRLARYGVEAGVRGAALLAVKESVIAS